MVILRRPIIYITDGKLETLKLKQKFISRLDVLDTFKVLRIYVYKAHENYPCNENGVYCKFESNYLENNYWSSIYDNTVLCRLTLCFCGWNVYFVVLLKLFITDGHIMLMDVATCSVPMLFSLTMHEPINAAGTYCTSCKFGKCGEMLTNSVNSEHKIHLIKTDA